jgi:hypothetical protein
MRIWTFGFSPGICYRGTSFPKIVFLRVLPNTQAIIYFNLFRERQTTYSYRVPALFEKCQNSRKEWVSPTAAFALINYNGKEIDNAE